MPPTVRRRPLALGCMPPTRRQPPQAEPWTAVARRSRDTAWGWARVLNNQETKDTNRRFPICVFSFWPFGSRPLVAAEALAKSDPTHNFCFLLSEFQLFPVPHLPSPNFSFQLFSFFFARFLFCLTLPFNLHGKVKQSETVQRLGPRLRSPALGRRRQDARAHGRFGIQARLPRPHLPEIHFRRLRGKTRTIAVRLR